MKAIRLLGLALFIMVAALIDQPPASGDPVPPGDGKPPSLGDEITPGNYTYEQAKALGIETPLTPKEVGLPACDPPDPNWTPGDSPPPDDAPICAHDPHDVIISVGMPVPGPGPHHNGAQTNGRFEGGRIDVEVGNPRVDHSTTEFVAARTMAKIPDGNWCNENWTWIEAGWAEISWLADERFVYT